MADEWYVPPCESHTWGEKQGLEEPVRVCVVCGEMRRECAVHECISEPTDNPYGLCQTHEEEFLAWRNRDA